jgi:hypothetical protein
MHEITSPLWYGLETGRESLCCHPDELFSVQELLFAGVCQACKELLLCGFMRYCCSNDFRTRKNAAKLYSFTAISVKHCRLKLCVTHFNLFLIFCQDLKPEKNKKARQIAVLFRESDGLLDHAFVKKHISKVYFLVRN